MNIEKGFSDFEGQKENIPMCLQKFPTNKSLSQTGIETFIESLEDECKNNAEWRCEGKLFMFRQALETLYLLQFFTLQ